MTGMTILIPAAGASRRMRGTDKLMLEIAGEPILRRAAAMAAATGARVIVTLPRPSRFLDGRRAAIAGLPVQVLELDDADEGLAASLRAGARAAGRSAGLMVLLPDMPGTGPADLAGLIASFVEEPDRVLRATTADGAEGHPVIFPRRLFAALLRLAGDRGGRSLLKRERCRHYALPGRSALTDIDTPEDWDAWRGG